MKLSHRIMLPMAAIALLGASAAGVGMASAASSGTTGTLAQKIATALHVDASKVQAVIDQDHADHEQQREANYEKTLTQAVTDGKITDAQKQAILTEHNVLKAKLDTARDTTDKTARKTAMNNVRAEAQSWAKSNNIDEKYLMMMGGGHGGGPMGDHDGTPPADAPDASTAQ